MNIKPVLQNPWVQAATLLCGLLVVILVIYLLSPVLFPFLLAFLVAYILDPLVDFFEARRVPRSATIAGLGVIGVLILLSIPLFVVPGIIGQAEALISANTSTSTSAQDGTVNGQISDESNASNSSDDGSSGWLNSMLDKMFESKSFYSLAKILKWDMDRFEEVGPRKYFGEQVGSFVAENIQKMLPNLAEASANASITIAQFVSSIARGTMGMLLLLGNCALFAFVTGYLLRDYDRCISKINDLIPPRYLKRITDIMGKVNLQLRGFLRGQLLVCAALGTMYAVGLGISGVPFWFALGLFGGIASLVPYLGIALTIGPAVLLALLQHGLDWHVAGAVATFVIAQTIEGTVLTPKIVGDQVGLGPVWVILAIMVFGSALGFLGLLVAVPIAAVIKVFLGEAIASYKKSPLYADGASGEDSSSES